MKRASISDLDLVATDILGAAGLSSDDSKIVGENLVRAEARGVFSHGLILLPTYVRRILERGIRTDYIIEITSESSTTALVDGGGAPGQIVVKRLLDIAVDKAKESGMSFATAINSNHLGMLAGHSEPVAERTGYIVVLTTTAGRSVTPPEGIGSQLGNNALCVTLGTNPPLSFDIATGLIAGGKIRHAKLQGQPIPDEWCDQTKDPSGAGSIPVFGGHKGFGINLLIDILGPILAGGVVSFEMPKQRNALSRPIMATHSALLIDPKAVGGPDDFLDRVGKFLSQVRDFPHRDGGTIATVFGDTENRNYARSVESGIEIGPEKLELIREQAEIVGRREAIAGLIDQW